MSNTRHVQEGTAPAQFGFASAPQYAEQRGICGTIVAAKAGLMDAPEKRSLLFFLQAQAMRPGGFKRLAQELLELFPERLGSQTMVAAGIEDGKQYDQDTAVKIYRELYPDEAALQIQRECFAREAKYARRLRSLADAALLGTDVEPDATQEPRGKQYEASCDKLRARCRELAQRLPAYLELICLDPKIKIALPREKRVNDEAYAEVSYFQDLVETLLEYQRRHAQQARKDFVLTSIGKQVWESLDFALGTQTMAVIEGDPRFGKSAAAEAWLQQHTGEARYAKLQGVNSRTVFFRTLAKALGLPSTFNLSPVQMQSRVEDFLRNSRLMLVLDDAQFLWPQSQRIYTRPELLDWVTTALFNEGIPVALITWGEFARRRVAVESQTDWQGTHLSGRTTLYKKIEKPPTEADFTAVTKRLLAEGCPRCVKAIVGYASTSKRYMQAVVDLVKIARYLAGQEGRKAVVFEDVRRAIFDYRMPSDAAQMSPAPASTRRRRTAALPVQTPGNPDAAPLPEVPRRGDFAGAEPADSSIEMPPERRSMGGQLLGA